jgi:hypothetical protein
MLIFLTEKDVAKQINVSLASLRRWRLEGRGPRFETAARIFSRCGAAPPVTVHLESLNGQVLFFSAQCGRGKNLGACS